MLFGKKNEKPINNAIAGILNKYKRIPNDVLVKITVDAAKKDINFMTVGIRYIDMYIADPETLIGYSDLFEKSEISVDLKSKVIHDGGLNRKEVNSLYHVIIPFSHTKYYVCDLSIYVSEAFSKFGISLDKILQRYCHLVAESFFKSKTFIHNVGCYGLEKKSIDGFFPSLSELQNISVSEFAVSVNEQTKNPKRRYAHDISIIGNEMTMEDVMNVKKVYTEKKKVNNNFMLSQFLQGINYS